MTIGPERRAVDQAAVDRMLNQVRQEGALGGLADGDSVSSVISPDDQVGLNSYPFGEVLQPGEDDEWNIVATEGPDGSEVGAGKPSFKPRRLPHIYLPAFGIVSAAKRFEDRFHAPAIDESSLVKIIGGVAATVAVAAFGAYEWTAMEIAGTEQYIVTAKALNSEPAKGVLKPKAIAATRITEVTQNHDAKLPASQNVSLYIALGSATIAGASFSTAYIKGSRRQGR